MDWTPDKLRNLAACAKNDWYGLDVPGALRWAADEIERLAEILGPYRCRGCVHAQARAESAPCDSCARGYFDRYRRADGEESAAVVKAMKENR